MVRSAMLPLVLSSMAAVVQPAFVPPTFAQVMDASSVGEPVKIPRDANWRYHDEAPGESGLAAGWASAQFDDSQWTAGTDGSPETPVNRWFRLKVKLPQA